MTDANVTSDSASDGLGVHRADIERIARLAREQSTKVLRKLPVLGPIAWLMMASPMTRHTLLSELEWRVMPALMLDQAKLYLRDEQPVAFASWAKLSPEAVARYCLPPHHLAAADWVSGDQIWLVDVFTPYGGAQDVLKDLRENVFAGQPVHQLLPNGHESKTMMWPAAGGG